MVFQVNLINEVSDIMLVLELNLYGPYFTETSPNMFLNSSVLLFINRINLFSIIEIMWVVVNQIKDGF